MNVLNQLAAILPGQLYLTSSRGANNWALLEEAGIQVVVNVSFEVPNHFEGKKAIEYYRVRVEDIPSADLGSHFDEVTEYIERARLAGRPVLVHCVAGVSRSVSVILAYLVRYQQMTLDDAFKHVKAQRPPALPNIGFWDQLFAWELRFRNKVSIDQRRFIRQREFVRQVSLNGDALFGRRLSDNGCSSTGASPVAAAAAAARDSHAAACTVATHAESSGNDDVAVSSAILATVSLE